MPSISQILSGNLGGPTVPAGGESLFGNLPWAVTGNSTNTNVSNATGGTQVNSAFFHYLAPKGELWDKLVPYRLVVIDTTNKNQVVGGNSPSKVSVNPLGNGTLAFEPLSTAWEFFLPITPQQLSITDAYSINTSATLRGVLEEHSGVRFKNITIQGSFGVWPGRASIVSAPTNATGASRGPSIGLWWHHSGGPERGHTVPDHY